MRLVFIFWREMRLLLLLFLLNFFGFVQTAKSQIPANQVKIDQFKINNTIVIGYSETQIVNSLGAYTGMGGSKVAQEIWEIEGITVKVLNYPGKGKMKVYQSRLVSFEITGPGIPIHYNNDIFKVGDNISVLSTIFPISYSNRYTKLIVIKIFGIAGDGTIVVSDESFKIDFDQNTNLITKIRYSR